MLRRTVIPAPESTHASANQDPDPPLAHKAPPAEPKFPPCMPSNASHHWPPHEQDPRHLGFRLVCQETPRDEGQCVHSILRRPYFAATHSIASLHSPLHAFTSSTPSFNAFALNSQPPPTLETGARVSVHLLRASRTPHLAKSAPALKRGGLTAPHRAALFPWPVQEARPLQPPPLRPPPRSLAPAPGPIAPVAAAPVQTTHPHLTASRMLAFGFAHMISNPINPRCHCIRQTPYGGRSIKVLRKRSEEGAIDSAVCLEP